MSVTWPLCGAQSERPAPALESAVQETRAWASNTQPTHHSGRRVSRRAWVRRSAGRNQPSDASQRPRAARAANCAVLTASADAPEPSEIRKVLVATDFSRDAEAALTWAQMVAARSGATLALIHSVIPPFGVGEEELYAEDKRTSEEIERSLARLEVIAAGVDVDVEISVGRRYPETDALREAVKSGADLILISISLAVTALNSIKTMFLAITMLTSLVRSPSES